MFSPLTFKSKQRFYREQYFHSVEISRPIVNLGIADSEKLQVHKKSYRPLFRMEHQEALIKIPLTRSPKINVKNIIKSSLERIVMNKKKTIDTLLKYLILKKNTANDNKACKITKHTKS